jgi:hypothetical protein
MMESGSRFGPKGALVRVSLLLLPLVAPFVAAACGDGTDESAHDGSTVDGSVEASRSRDTSRPDTVTLHDGSGESDGNPLDSRSDFDTATTDVSEAAAEDADAAEDDGLEKYFDAGALDTMTASDVPLDVYPAPHPAMPSVVDLGGQTLTAPNIVPIFYSGDPSQTDLVAMVSGLGASSYWSATTSEYGIGPATSSPPLVIAGPAPAILDDSAVQSLLDMNLDGPTSLWGTPAPNDIYLLFVPPGTDLVAGFPAYHSFTANSLDELIVYAVVSYEPGDDMTYPASHELIEATTDPEFSAYAIVDANDGAWGLPLPGGSGLAAGSAELGDMCELYTSSAYVPPDLPFTVQRTWSNASAAASHDPCVPIPSGEVYFNSAIVPTDNVVIAGGLAITHGVKILASESRTIEIDLYSDAPTSGPWTLSAETAAVGALTFSFDKNTGVNGDKVHLTITVAPSATGDEPFTIVSTLGAMTTYWYGVVGN